MPSKPTSTPASISRKAFRVVAPIVLCLLILTGIAGQPAQAEPTGSRSPECVELADQIKRFKRLRDIADDISHLTPVEAGITVSWIIGSDLGMKAHMIIVELTNRFFRLGCDPTLLD
jgi:hypothetical protein